MLLFSADIPICRFVALILLLRLDVKKVVKKIRPVSRHLFGQSIDAASA